MKCGKEMMNHAFSFHANKMTANLNENQVKTCIIWDPVKEALCTPLCLEVLGCPRRSRHRHNQSASRRLADALKLQDQMALPAKALPEGAKRKVGWGEARLPPRAPRLAPGLLAPRAPRPAPTRLLSVAAELRAEHPGEPGRAASGRANHGAGPRGAAADVVRGVTLSVSVNRLSLE